MDLFTHILVAYLVTFGVVGFQPSYLAAGALAGGLPDADALFFPISRRFPILRHHGITHSLTGVTIVAVAGAFLAPMLAPGSVLIYFIVMEIGGICHILQDAFTNFAVPPLLPFSKRQVHLDADRAVNFFTLIFSVASFYLLLGVERNHVPFAWYLLTVYALMAFFAAYFAIRLAGRIKVQGVVKREGYNAVTPTSDPFRWVLIREAVVDGRAQMRWARYVFGHGITDGPHTVEAPLVPPPHQGPPTSEAEALEWSYGLARNASRTIEDTYHFGEASCLPTGEWVATWYSLEFSAFGRSAGVRVRFPPDGGAPVVKSAFVRPALRPA